MSSKSFDNYGALARQSDTSHTEVAGRYEFQASAERRIIGDVVQKLSLESGDSLLEIGCGPGNLLLPLSYMVESAAGIDSAATLKRLSARCGGNPQILLFPGDFLSMALPELRFSKVLVYSVMQCLESAEAVKRFIARALELLKPGGRLLVGDVPNVDKKHRFSDSASGQVLSADWSARVAAAGPHPLSALPTDDRVIAIDDELVLALLMQGRASGFESYLLEQSPKLPFGNTRDDLLFVARA